MFMAESQFSARKINCKLRNFPNDPNFIHQPECLLYVASTACCPDIRGTQWPLELHLK